MGRVMKITIARFEDEGEFRLADSSAVQPFHRCESPMSCTIRKGQGIGACRYYDCHPSRSRPFVGSSWDNFQPARAVAFACSQSLDSVDAPADGVDSTGETMCGNMFGVLKTFGESKGRENLDRAS